MPNRMIFEDWLDNDAVLDLSHEAFRLFVGLWLLADECGLVSLAPARVARRCFAQRPTHEVVNRLLGELNDADLLRPYVVGRAMYGFLPRYNQRLRMLNPKLPLPPEALYADDDRAVAKFNRIKHLPVGTPDNRQQRAVTRGPEVEVEVEVEENNGAAAPPSKRPKTKKASARFELPEEIPRSTWDRWDEYKGRQKGWSTQAKKLSATRMLNLKTEGHDLDKCVDLAIESTWTSLYGRERGERCTLINPKTGPAPAHQAAHKALQESEPPPPPGKRWVYVAGRRTLAEALPADETQGPD